MGARHDSRTATAAVLAASDARVREKIRATVETGAPVVLDASLSTRAIRDELRAFVASVGGTAQLVLVDAPVEVIAERMRVRAARADANALYLDDDASGAYRASFELPGADEPHEVRDGTP